MTAGVVDVVVRTRGAWLLAPVPAEEPTPLDLDGVLALLDTDGVIPPEVRPTDWIARDEHIRPVWMLVGLVDQGRLVIEGADGAPLRLDATDVRLLDALRGETTVDDLDVPGSPIPVEERQARLGRLRRARRVLGREVP